MNYPTKVEQPLRRLSDDRIETIMERGLGCYGQGDAVLMAHEIRDLRAKINNPVIDEFFEGVRVEQAHQVERWGPDHDARKTPEDWIALLTYLQGKAIRAAWECDWQKFTHHIVTGGAVYANFYRRMKDWMVATGRWPEVKS